MSPPELTETERALAQEYADAARALHALDLGTSEEARRCVVGRAASTIYLRLKYEPRGALAREDIARVFCDPTHTSEAGYLASLLLERLPEMPDAVLRETVALLAERWVAIPGRTEQPRGPTARMNRERGAR